MNQIKAWHFVDDRLRDGRLVPADGVVLKHEGPLLLCESGLHWSPTPFEALRYAPGPHLCLVECSGKIVTGYGANHDKGICSERTIVARMDATDLLRYFARQAALSCVHLWEPDDVVLDFLAGDESLRAAANAAASAVVLATAAWAAWAANAAAWTVAGEAARAAASAAANAAAWTVAGEAARAAASAATGEAALDALAQEFNELVYLAFEDWLGLRPLGLGLLASSTQLG